MQLPPALNQMNTMPGQHQQDMSQQMPEQGMDENMPEPEQILAHVSPDEIPYLNELQGQEIIDPDTGLRDYTMIEYLLDIPEYRQGMEEAAGMLKSKKMAQGGPVSEQGRPIAPELEELRRAGRHGDTELIIITPKIADFFESVNEGKTTINPTTGFPEYGFFKELLRIAAPIVGAVFGGPVGAFAASTAANKVTGKSWGDSLKQGALSGGLAFAAPMVGIGGLGGGIGGSGGLGSMLGVSPGGMGGIFGGTGGGGGILASLGGGAAQTGSGPLASTTGGAAKAATAGGTTQGGGGLGSIFNLGGGILPLAAAGLMAYKGNQQEKKDVTNYDEKQRQDLEQLRQKYGFNTPWKEVKPLNRELQMELSPEDNAAGREHSFFKNNRLGDVEYKKDGGVIRGIGKGQQDNIPKNLKEGSYIIDASSVSDLGDGSSQAGIRELDQFFAKIPSQRMHKKEGGYISALLSPEEYEVPSEKVTALGGGSNSQGAKILKSLVKSLRNTKRTSGNQLPPKSKPISGYLSSMKVA